MSEATQAAAGLITGGILEEAVTSGYSVDEKTAEAVTQQQGPEPQEQEGPPPAPPDPLDEIVDSLTSEQAEKTEDVSEAMPEPDEDFEVPDFEAEVEKELLDREITTSSEEGWKDDDEWEPEDRDAQKRALIAERKAAYYENLTATRERAKWEKEADKHYPLWRARGEIAATSKRGFMKAAKEANDAVKPFVKAAVKTREEQLQAERASMKEEVKQEAAEAWGKPTVANNVQVGPTDYDAAEKAYNEARKNQDLAAMLSYKRIMQALRGGEE